MGVVYYDGDAARTRAALLEGCGAILARGSSNRESSYGNS
jgi:hypothetical protein